MKGMSGIHLTMYVYYSSRAFSCCSDCFVLFRLGKAKLGDMRGGV